MSTPVSISIELPETTREIQALHIINTSVEHIMGDADLSHIEKKKAVKRMLTWAYDRYVTDAPHSTQE